MDVRADAAGGGEWVTDLRVELNEGYLIMRRHDDEASQLVSLMLWVRVAGELEGSIAFIAGLNSAADSDSTPAPINVDSGRTDTSEKPQRQFF